MRSHSTLARQRNKLFQLLAFFSVGLTPCLVQAHAVGENYVWVNVDTDHLAGRFEIHFRDLETKLGIRWQDYGETRSDAVANSAEQVHAYLREHFQLLFDGNPQELLFETAGVDSSNPNFAQYFYRTAVGVVPDRFTIRNDIFITPDDPLHRSLIVIEYNRKLQQKFASENAVMAFGPHNPEQELDLNNLPALLKPLDFVWQGILHIWIGIDHILFLLALLLLSVIVWEDGTWKPVPTFKTALWNVIKIVTIFTVAHSITLSLAALNILNVSSRLVESLIALSIVLVAMNNVFPKFNDKTWLVIFFFGLFHGMGFASVMGDLPFRTISLLRILLAFNIGVELGQIVIVAAIFPLIYALRKTSFYRPAVVVGGSLIIGAIASYWFVERAFIT